MADKKLHDNEVDVSIDLVRELVTGQLPQWSDLALTEFQPSGTVNVIYRLGSDMYVRLPRNEEYVAGLNIELKWLPRLAPQLPVPMPEPLGEGKPGSGYPFPWAVFRWIEAETYATGRVSSELDAAHELAHFILALRGIDVSDAPRSHRDDAVTADAFTQHSLETLPDTFNKSTVNSAWQQALQAPAWNGQAVWTHGDLVPLNVLVRDGNLRAILDFGSVGTGDPAVDVIPAWSLVNREARAAFRQALNVDEPTWARARALALRQAVRIIPYYRDTHQDFVTMATATVNRVLDDLGSELPPAARSLR